MQDYTLYIRGIIGEKANKIISLVELGIKNHWNIALYQIIRMKYKHMIISVHV